MTRPLCGWSTGPDRLLVDILTNGLPDGLLGGNLATSRRFRVYILESTNSLARARKRQTFL